MSALGVNARSRDGRGPADGRWVPDSGSAFHGEGLGGWRRRRGRAFDSRRVVLYMTTRGRTRSMTRRASSRLAGKPFASPRWLDRWVADVDTGRRRTASPPSLTSASSAADPPCTATLHDRDSSCPQASAPHATANGPLKAAGRAAARRFAPHRPAMPRRTRQHGRVVTCAAISLPCRDTRSLRSWRYAAPDAFRGFGDRRKRAPPDARPILVTRHGPEMVRPECPVVRMRQRRQDLPLLQKSPVLLRPSHGAWPQTHGQPDSDATSLTAHRYKIIGPAHGAGHIAGWRLRWYASWLALIGQ